MVRRWSLLLLAINSCLALLLIGAEELRTHCAALLSPHKVPRDIRFVDALPRNSMGKVQKTQLRQRG